MNKLTVKLGTICLVLFFPVLAIVSCYDTKDLCSNSVSGRIVLSGEGMFGVRLVLDSSDKPEFERYTDSDGNFEFTGMWSGEYTLTPVDSTCNFDIESVEVNLEKRNSTGNVFEIILSWQKFFGNDNATDSFQISDIYQTSDYGYLVTGSTNVGDDTRIFYWKLDQFGNVLWTQRFDGYDVTSGVGCAEYDSSGYVISGNLDGTAKTDIFALAVSSSDGAVTDSKVWSSDEDDSISSMMYYDGYFYFPGFTGLNIGGVDGLIIRASYSGSAWTSVWNTRSDYDGLIVSSGDQKIELRQSKVYASGGTAEGVVSAGLKVETYKTDKYTLIYSKIYMCKHNFNGICVAENYSNVFSNNDEAVDVVQLDDESIVAAALTDSTEGSLKNIMLLKYDADLNLSESRRIGENDDYRVCSVINSGNNTFMILGSHVENGVHRAFLRKFDSNFNTLWTKYFDFTSDGDSTPVKIISTKDGGYMMCGYFEYLGKYKSFIVKLNRNCGVLSCNIDTTVRDI